MTTITAIGNQEPIEPSSWQAGAKAALSHIFESVPSILADDGYREDTGNGRTKNLMISSARNRSNEIQELEDFLRYQSNIESQFEGMVINSKWFRSDAAFWLEEWKILGSLAAAAGIGTGVFPENLTEFWSPGRSSVEQYAYQWMSHAQILETLIRKQFDYGHHNISRFGRYGLIVRVHDKIARLNNLVTRGDNPKNESILDTYTDIVGYSAIGIMWERGWFELELAVQ